MQAKPYGSQWTDDQWAAISRRGDNILVAAAAGSGKTAVLVERIIRRITDPLEPLDVDQLLVATFTKAAAAEMKQRIREAMEQLLESEPHNEHVRRQLALIHRASITTLHSFCMEVIQKYAPLLELDPSFRVANETEAELIRQDALEELFEDYYGSSDEESPFWQLVDVYSGEKSDAALFSLVLQIYDFSRSQPSPEMWLRDQADIFEQGSHVDRWLDSLRQDVALDLEGMKSALQKAITAAEQPSGPQAYLENLYEEQQQLLAAEEQLKTGNWDELCQAFQEISFKKLKSVKKDEVDGELQTAVQELRNGVKKRVAELQEELFARSTAQYTSELKQISPLIRALVELVIEFSGRYQTAKRAKGLVDFNDLEHYTLQLLQSEEEPDQPSKVALSYQDQFAEILLDEYQDTNRVQEKIVSLLARSYPGNRFMVGDVKQSIYRFRLAEPALFLEKYKSYQKTGSKPENAENTDTGTRIDLARNFRSRPAVIEGVNDLFQRIMNEAVGEIVYDTAAELVYGADYPEMAQSHFDPSVEVLLADRSGSSAGMNGTDDVADEPETEEIEVNRIDSPLEGAELEAVQLEARLVASQIRKYMGADEHDQAEPFLVYDSKKKLTRPLQCKDIVVLMRATEAWAPVFLEEFRNAGIPGYADLNRGYFSAGEVEMMLSLLKIIDNPFQDIPLAAVLRSPIVQCSAEDLARIRLAKHGVGYYEALIEFSSLDAPESANVRMLQNKCQAFLEQLYRWRDQARKGSLADLIWHIYGETGLYEIAGGLPGGKQRQANLKALYDRARQYESTSFRGLFRFLRFIERMQERGTDLGSARAIGEQEDVVRIMSIHKSKGLEFPLVFVAGLNRPFNKQDLRSNFLLHKHFGIAPRLVDSEKRISYPSLPYLAIRRRIGLELLAEEMRVLYVAMTRAKEKLVLIGTAKDAGRELQKWLQDDDSTPAAHTLANAVLAKAKSYMDWIMPAMLNHPAANVYNHGEPALIDHLPQHHEQDGRWNIHVLPADMDWFKQAAASVELPDDVAKQALRQLEPLAYQPSAFDDDVRFRLEWKYPYQAAVSMFSKTSVSEMKRLHEKNHQHAIEQAWPDAENRFAGALQATAGDQRIHKIARRRPRFMEQQRMTAAERGTIYHTIMQHFPLGESQQGITEENVIEVLQDLLTRQLLSESQLAEIDPTVIAGFFISEPGQMLLQSKNVYRELPFSYGLPAHEVYALPNFSAAADDSLKNDQRFAETVLIQGVIDCLFEAEEGWVLLDYKTDRIDQGVEHIRERYKLQMELYAKAIEDIWKQPVRRKVIFCFDGAHVLQM